MSSENIQIEKLIAFKERDKFSTNAWNERGLNPSGTELCLQMADLFDFSVDELIRGINGGYSVRQLKSVLKSSLGRFNRLDYDTEEKEFICDLFQELALIVNVDFKGRLNIWLYGSGLNLLMNLFRYVNPVKIVKTFKQTCTKCGVPLVTHILKTKKGIPETSWLVAKCNNCGEPGLISAGPNVKELRFGNYQCVEMLQMDEYTYEQALIRLEQIKYFRK